MMNKQFGSLLCVLTLLAASQVAAKDQGKNHGNHGGAKASETKDNSASKTDPAVQGRIVITTQEREIIHSYAHDCVSVDASGKPGKGLPPGLSKKVARGRSLPPGWQSKCVVGEIMPKEVYKRCQPLPKEIVVKLPPAPAGTIMVAIDGKVARLAKATLEILDVFDVL